jgi:hypothetical protein
MRETQMKKIIAAAVASAFIAPAFAADVSLSGSVEFNVDDNNGTTVTNTDSAFKVSATTETASGISVTGNINVQANSATTDATVAGNGGDSLVLEGDFGKLELGDTSSAADKFDDRGEFGSFLNGNATTAGDAAVGWTLPTLVEGATVYVSYTGDSSSEGDAHSGLGVQYTTGPVTVAYAKNTEEANNSDLTYVGATVSMSGFTVTVDSMEDEGGGTKIDEKLVGVKYSMGDATIYANNLDYKSGGTKTKDITSYGLHYDLGGGVTAFVEALTDDKNAAAESTGVGLSMAF